jgi:rsbT co-antagonist protein RsbR
LFDLVQTRELPVLNIGEHVLAVPLVGHLDSRRLAAIRNAVLRKVAEQRTHTVIFDITGIAMSRYCCSPGPCANRPGRSLARRAQPD